MSTVWEQLEADCLQVYSLPHNVVHYKEKYNKTPAEAARDQVADVKSGLGNAATRREFVGPRLFLRVAGIDARARLNDAYSGQWWFDPDILHGLDSAYARIYFQSADRKRAVRDMLRELLAITTGWNSMEEVWALALPPGERLVGYAGHGAPQQLFGNLPLSAIGNRMLVGQAEQIFFPPKHNPLWVTKYRDL